MLANLESDSCVAVVKAYKDWPRTIQIKTQYYLALCHVSIVIWSALFHVPIVMWSCVVMWSCIVTCDCSCYPVTLCNMMQSNITWTGLWTWQVTMTGTWFSSKAPVLYWVQWYPCSNNIHAGYLSKCYKCPVKSGLISISQLTREHWHTQTNLVVVNKICNAL